MTETELRAIIDGVSFLFVHWALGNSNGFVGRESIVLEANNSKAHSVDTARGFSPVLETLMTESYYERRFRTLCFG